MITELSRYIRKNAVGLRSFGAATTRLDLNYTLGLRPNDHKITQNPQEHVMDGDYVEDSEGEGGLDFSPSGYGQPVALDASFPSLQGQDTFSLFLKIYRNSRLRVVHPGPKSYSPSTISEFPSTLQATGMQSFDSPIVEFTATTHSSTAKKLPFKKRPKSSAVEIIDLSDDEDEIVIHRSRKPLRKRAASLSESSGDERTPSTGNTQRLT